MFPTDMIYAKANDQFELEGKSLIGLLPMLTCRLRYSGTGKPRVIPPIKRCSTRLLSAGNFPLFDFHSVNRSCTSATLHFLSKLPLARPSVNLRTQDLEVQYTALILLACYQVKIVIVPPPMQQVGVGVDI